MNKILNSFGINRIQTSRRSAHVYKGASQDFAALQQHVGEDVRITGAVNGDTITVSEIAASKKKS